MTKKELHVCIVIAVAGRCGRPLECAAASLRSLRVLAFGHFGERFLETTRLYEAGPRSQEQPLVGPVGARRWAAGADQLAAGRRRHPIAERHRVALGAVDFARFARHRAEQLLRQFVGGAQRLRPLLQADFVLRKCGRRDKNHQSAIRFHVL